MTTERIDTSIEILGKTYQIKCPESELSSLQRAAHYLEEKMRNLYATDNLIGIERVAVVTALNLVHQLFTVEQQKNREIQAINQRLHDLQVRLEGAIVQHKQLELEPVK